MGNTCGCGKDPEDRKHEIAADYQLDEDSKVRSYIDWMVTSF